jgi:anti-anti-sigma factor
MFGMATEDDGDGAPVLRVWGELDLGNAAAVAASIAELLGQGRGVVVDLEGLTFVDSTGLGAFVRSRNLAARSRQHIVLRKPPPGILRVLQITGLDGIFAIKG